MDQITQQLGNIDIDPPLITWFDLPLEMREMVIDRMDPTTRCKFAQCSKLCEKEAKKSRNYLYELGCHSSSSSLLLSFSHVPMPYDNPFSLEFYDGGYNQTIVEYKNRWLEVKWSKFEPGKPVDVRWKYFIEYLEKYKHCIRSFVLSDENISVTDFNVKLLKNLECLLLVNFLSEDSRLNIIESGFIDWKQVIWLKTIWVSRFKFTFEQVTKLNGKIIQITSNEFNKENMNKYLKMIKKGEIHENSQRIKVELKYNKKTIDVDDIMDGLDVLNYSSYVDDEQLVFYKFNFLSDVKKNGPYSVTFFPHEFISVEWYETEQPV